MQRERIAGIPLLSTADRSLEIIRSSRAYQARCHSAGAGVCHFRLLLLVRQNKEVIMSIDPARRHDLLLRDQSSRFEPIDAVAARGKLRVVGHDNQREFLISR